MSRKSRCERTCTRTETGTATRTGIGSKPTLNAKAWRLIGALCLALEISGCRTQLGPAEGGVPAEPGAAAQATDRASLATATHDAPLSADDATSTSLPTQSTPSPNVSPSPTLVDSTAFLTGSLAGALAGSADCHLPCWLGLTPGQDQLEDVDRWIFTEGLSGRAERSEDEAGATIGARSVNPGGVLSGKAEQLVTAVHRDRLAEILVLDAPIARPMIDEIKDLVTLLGVPDHILLWPTPGYTLRLDYPAQGLEVRFWVVAEKASAGGGDQDVLCIASQMDRTADFVIYDSASRHLTTDDLASDWAMNLGVLETELLGWMLDPDECVPIP